MLSAPTTTSSPTAPPAPTPLVCNGTEVCQGGVCSPGTSLVCDDTNACTTDICSEPVGCGSTAIAGCCNVDADCADANVLHHRYL